MKTQKIITAVILIMIVISVSTDGTKAQKALHDRYIKHELKYVTPFICATRDLRMTQTGTTKKEVLNDTKEENSIKLESWMLNPESWVNNASNLESKDEVITLKDWMLNTDKMYNSLTTSNRLNDPEIFLEDWMLAPSKMMVEQDTDPVIELSGWMLDQNKFKKMK